MLMQLLLLGALAIGATACEAWQASGRVTLLAGEGCRALQTGATGMLAVQAEGEAGGRIGGLEWRAAGTAWGRDCAADGAELRELVVRWRDGPLGLALGRQVVAWGRTDGIAPSDQWTPRRLDGLALDDAGSYRGADTAQAWLDAGPARLNLLLSPHGRTSLQGEGLYGPGWRPASRSLAASWHRPAVALRVESQGRGIDAALTWLRGAELLPALRLDDAGQLQARHGRLAMLGADAATALGGWVLRGEWAQLRRERAALGDGPADSTHLVLGVEHTLANDWILLLQGLSSRHELRAASGLVADFNRLQFHQQRRRYEGATLSLQLDPVASVHRFQWAMTRLSGGETALRWRLESPLAGDWRVGLLLERYRGPKGSSFDALSRNNLAWITLSRPLTSTGD